MKYKLVNSKITKDYGRELLKERGVLHIEDFLVPHQGMLQDYKALDNIEKGARRLLHAVSEDEKVLVIVDSDLDGMTSAAIIVGYLKKALNFDADYDLHQGKEHGLEDFVDKLEKEQKYQLVVLPDAGSNDQEYQLRLAEVGMDVLVVDHHEKETEEEVSNTIIINNQTSLNYKNKALTGAGVAYQFCRQMDELLDLDLADDFIDLAAVGIIGDMGSVIQPENRFIINKGLKYPTKSAFLNTVYEKQSYPLTKISDPTPEELNEAITPIAIAFYVAPLVNAMIRFGEQKEKIRLFEAMLDGEKLIPSTKRGAKGEMLPAAEEAIRESSNARNRQNKQKEKFAEMLERKIEEEKLLDNMILFIDLEDIQAPSELNGLICMELSKKYNRPTLLGRTKGDQVKGSIRGLNHAGMGPLKDFLLSTGLFTYVQGHQEAAGYGISTDNVSTFLEISNERLKDVDFGEDIHLVNFIMKGYERELHDLILDLTKFDRLWGQGNPEPLIAIENITIAKRDVSFIGAKKETIKFTYQGVEYIKFRAKDLAEQIENLTWDNLEIAIVGRPYLNEWNGIIKPQIMITDLEISDGRYSF